MYKVKQIVFIAFMVVVSACAPKLVVDAPRDISQSVSPPVNPDHAGILPYFRPPPLYPRVAVDSRQEGWVSVMMDIMEDGTSENIRVVDSSPKKIFDRFAVKSASGYLFKPVTKDGKTVVVHDYQVVIVFKLE